MTIFAMVNAEKEGEIESKVMRTVSSISCCLLHRAQKYVETIRGYSRSEGKGA